MNTKFLLGVILILVLVLGIKILTPYIYNKKINEVSIVREDTNSIANVVREKTIEEYSNAIAEGFKSPDTPKIIFGPSITSSEEKEDIKKKLLDPYEDFNRPTEPTEQDTFLFIVNKNDQKEFNENRRSYQYQVNIIRNNGESGGWLAGTIGSPLEYWTPNCLGDCKFSPEFSKKYPEIVKKYRELNSLK